MQKPNWQYLVVASTGQVFMADRNAIFGRTGGPAALTVVDLWKCFEMLKDAIGESDRFKMDDLCRLTGAAYATICGWQTAGLVRPSIRGAKASGGSSNARLFSPVDLFIVATISTLRRQGVPFDWMPRIVKAIREEIEPENQTQQGETAAIATAN